MRQVLESSLACDKHSMGHVTAATPSCNLRPELSVNFAWPGHWQHVVAQGHCVLPQLGPEVTNGVICEHLPYPTRVVC